MTGDLILMRALVSFRNEGVPTLKGTTFLAGVHQAIEMLRSGHAVAVNEGDLRRLATEAGLKVHTRRPIRGYIGQ